MGLSLFEINRLEMKDGVFTFSDQPNRPPSDLSAITYPTLVWFVDECIRSGPAIEDLARPLLGELPVVKVHPGCFNSH